MPELPEVETIKRGLASLLPGREVADVGHDWHKSFPNAPADVARFLVGAKVTDVRRRAKVLIIDLDTNYSLVIHLKMTGQLIFVLPQKLQTLSPNVEFLNKSQITNHRGLKDLEIRNSNLELAKSGPGRFGGGHPNDSLIGKLPDKSTHVTIDFKDKSKLFFNDQRKFGWMRLLPTAQIPEIDFFKTVGPEPLEDDFTVEKFIDQLKTRKGSGIKAVLLDQKVLAGVGNIYADEALFAAKIHPSTLVSKISRIKMVSLHKNLRDILNLSIKKGGSTDRNYVDSTGKKGSYLSFAQVFRREGQACMRCGDTIIKIRVAGRGTHICPSCQKA